MSEQKKEGVKKNTKKPEQVKVDFTPTAKTEVKETTGVVLIAVGHPMYTHYAYNLCVSLKFHNPEIPVTIVTRGGGWDYLFEDQKGLFDHRIEATDDWLHSVHGYDPFYAKLNLDLITPYTRTLFLDVDMIWNNNHTVGELLDSLKGISFTMANRGRTGEGAPLKSGWIELSELTKAYDLTEVYDLSSEVIYFEAGTKVFEAARKVYHENKMVVKGFGGGKPDEVYFSVAIEQLGIKLHQCPWFPTYWQPFYFQKISKEEFIMDHFATSIGGAYIQSNTNKIYNRLCRHYFNRMGIPHQPYQQQAKSRILKERRHI